MAAAAQPTAPLGQQHIFPFPGTDFATRGPATACKTRKSHTNLCSTALSAITATSDSRRLSHDSGSGLLSLPPEIRNIIFEMILAKNQPIRMSCDETIGRPTSWPDIADTWQQLRAETLPVFFGRNSFAYDAILGEPVEDSHAALFSWTFKIAQAPASLVSPIQPIKIDFCDDSMGKMETLWHSEDKGRHLDEPVFLPHFCNADRLLGTIGSDGSPTLLARCGRIRALGPRTARMV